MSVAKVIEIIAASKTSFDDAIKQGLTKASNTVEEITAAWIKDQNVVVEKGKITEYRVLMKVTFVIKKANRPSSKKK